MLNKKGQGLQISTIILIVLGLAVLVLLVFGFIVGWQKILPWISSNNVDTVVNQCQASCATNDAYGFCNLNRTLQSDDLPKDANGKDQKQVLNTCNYFSTEPAYATYSIAACPNLCPK